MDIGESAVSGKDGVATRRGSADDRADQRAAIANAYEGGALRVRDDLTRRGGSAESPPSAC